MEFVLFVALPLVAVGVLIGYVLRDRFDATGAGALGDSPPPPTPERPRPPLPVLTIVRACDDKQADIRPAIDRARNPWR